MGITGTEVSKDAAVMILTDDNFATIVNAVEYGRAIYDNLSKYIRYQMENLVGFIATFLGAAIFGILGGVPFQTGMILWLNFAITVPIAMALGFDKPAPDLMARKPRPLTQPVLSSPQWLRIVFLGLIITTGTLAVEAAYEPAGVVLATTMAATVFSLFNIFAGITVRSETETVLIRDIVSDRNQLRLYGLAILLTFLATELGFLQRVLGTTSLSFNQWLLCIGIAASLLVVEEVIKFFLRRSLDLAGLHAQHR
jgi:Ca2+-transporting ATPase